jgi:hypothetical protein
MYYRQNGQIVEGLRGTDSGGGCGCNIPSWVIILIVILMLIIISFFIYSLKSKGSRSMSSRRY